jgi:hypothetical protein
MTRRSLSRKKIFERIEMHRDAGPFCTADVAGEMGLCTRELVGILKAVPGARKHSDDTCIGCRRTYWIVEGSATA